MLSLLISIAGMILTILLIVGIHEFGHFITAKLLGVKVLEFSIGFGKSLWKFHDKSGTTYRLALIPLGGYVKMLDELETTVEPEEAHLSFNQQPLWKKFLIVAAGPFSNFVFAFLLYWFLFIHGFISVAPVIGKVAPHSIAEQAGLKPNQEIVLIENKPITSWMTIVIRLLSHTGNADFVKVNTRPLNTQALETHMLDLTHWRMDELRPDPLDSLGITPYVPDIPLVISSILPDSPAAKSPLKIGDKLIAIDALPMKDWETIMEYVDTHPEKLLTVRVERQGKTLDIPIQSGYKRDLFLKKHGLIGIAPSFEWPKNLLHRIQYSPLPALSHALQSTSDFTYLNFIMIGKLLTGKISLQSLGGPISIFQSAGTALNQGITPFLSFLAFLSISIGVINIIPIPGLDGGHILIQLIEVFYRKPLSIHVINLMYRLGFIFLFLLIFQAIMNDLLRL